MTIVQQIAKLFRDAYFGGNWTAVNLKDTLAGIDWRQATAKVGQLNTIAVLVFHMNYYVMPVAKVLQGQPLEASDKLSFELPPVTCEEDWQQLIERVMTEAEWFARQIEQLEEGRLFEEFSGQQYGNYYRNLHGVIEHTYYHMGQISLLKKMLNEGKSAASQTT